jgi:ABC-type proline/glycine betaine transport system permease subunit
MEVLESVAHLALGFVPTLAALEIAYRIGIKIKRRRNGLAVVSSVLPTTESLLPIAFRT